MSTSMMAILLVALFNAKFDIDFSFSKLRFSQNIAFISIISVFAMNLIGGLYSNNLDFWWNIIVLTCPLLFIPIAFILGPKIEKNDFIFLVYVFSLFLLLTGLYMLLNYFLHYKEMTDALSRGQPISSPFREHIRYSLMMTFSAISLLLLRIKKFSLSHKNYEKTLQVIIPILFIIILHVLTVRSGLLALYLCLFVFAIYFLFVQKRHLLSLALLLCILVSPLLAYQFIPSVKQKITYMSYDIQMLMNGQGASFSDSERLISMEVGVDLIKQHPILGVGTGDLKDEMNKVYELKHPSIENANRKLPHNQFIWIWASVGIIGFFVFLLSLIIPLLHQKNYRHLILILFFVISISSFITEHTLQIQVGLAFYTIWLCIILSFLNTNYEKKNSL